MLQTFSKKVIKECIKKHLRFVNIGELLYIKIKNFNLRSIQVHVREQQNMKQVKEIFKNIK